MFNHEGLCSLCAKQKAFVPAGEDKLKRIFFDAKAKKKEYDALVPLSGGKDSTFILHLAVNVYKLKVLTMTYDNGFLSPLALENIQKAVKISGVKHLFFRPDANIQKKVYGGMLLQSGDFCGACDIATKASIWKTAVENSIPLVLYGTSPLEEDSFIPDSIQDIARCKYILKKQGGLSDDAIRQFLIYPGLNLFKLSLYKKMGVFPKEVRPLFFIKNPGDKEMGETIAASLGWKDDTNREYSKHFDCTAEPLTNYIRHKIYGYERRLCQYSNMVRRGEITKEKAMALYAADNVDNIPANGTEVLNYLQLTTNDLQTIVQIPALKFESKTSFYNTLFAKCRKWIV